VDIRASLELSANGVAASPAVVDTSARARTVRVVGTVCIGGSDAWLDSTAKHRLAERTVGRYRASSITGANHVRLGARARPAAASDGTHASTRGRAGESVAAVARARAAIERG